MNECRTCDGEGTSPLSDAVACHDCNGSGWEPEDGCGGLGCIDEVSYPSPCPGCADCKPTIRVDSSLSEAEIVSTDGTVTRCRVDKGFLQTLLTMLASEGVPVEWDAITCSACGGVGIINDGSYYDPQPMPCPECVL